MQLIQYNKIVVGIKISSIKKGSLPQTQPDEPLQLVTLKHPKGAYLLAHMHTPKKRTTNNLQECLIVKKGKILIDLYSPNKILFKKVTLQSGDIFILQNGGYGIHLLENSELIELKNGPFLEDKILIET